MSKNRNQKTQTNSKQNTNVATFQGCLYVSAFCLFRKPVTALHTELELTEYMGFLFFFPAKGKIHYFD